MKTKFSNTELCHKFAEQSQKIGEACNMFMTSSYKLDYANKIYSYGYHYLLAEFISKDTILINNEGYSNTTSEHICLIRQATRQYKQFFTMSCDIDLVHSQIIENKNKLARARKPEMYVNSILSLHTNLIEFHTYTRKLGYLRKLKKFKEIQKIVNNINKPEYKEKLRELAEKQAKKQAIKNKEQIKKFVNYKINYIRSEFDYIRISRCRNFVETSQSVKVDIKEARMLFKLIKAGKDIKGYKIYNYTVISNNGVLKIGCHTIQKETIDNFANLLNW